MATKKAAAAKVAPTINPDPDTQEDGGGGAPADVTVIIPDEQDDTPPPPAPKAGGTTSGAPVAGEPHGYAAWVVPAPAPLATAAVGTPGYFMGIKAGVDTKTGPFAAWLGTDAPTPNWPN
jgi:hypothetical protein